MLSWRLIAPSQLESHEMSSEIVESAFDAKVKLTKCLLNKNDVAAFSGESDPSLPLVLGSFATGIIVEPGENCFGLEKNMRVYINPFQVCNDCRNCKAENFSFCTTLSVAGENAPGFLRDFAVVPAQQLSVLPDCVSDEEAVFIDYIALALNIIDTLDIQKGDHVAVLGFNTLGNILCQLIMYYQGVPILIENDEENIENAQKAGVYYIVNPDGNAVRKVSEITSGRMADKVVHTCELSVESKFALLLAGFGCKICFAGFDCEPSIRINLSQAMQKQLVIHTIKNGIGNTAAAINLIAKKALDLSALPKTSCNFSEVPDVLAEQVNLLKSEEKLLPLLVNLMG